MELWLALKANTSLRPGTHAERVRGDRPRPGAGTTGSRGGLAGSGRRPPRPRLSDGLRHAPRTLDGDTAVRLPVRQAGRRDRVRSVARWPFRSGPQVRYSAVDNGSAAARALPWSSIRQPGRAGTTVTTTGAAPYAFWLAGRPATGEDTFDVTSPWDGALVGRVSVPTDAQVEQAVAAAAAGAGRLRGDARARTGRGAGPRVPAAGRARRGDRPADHRRERQADQVGPRRGRPRRVRLPLGRRGGPPLQQRRGPAPGHRPGRRRPARADPPLPARPGARHRAVQLPAEPGRPQGRPGDRGRRARSSSSPRPATPLSALLLGELLAETDLPAGSWSVLPVPNDQMPALVAGPAAAGHLLHRLRHGRLPDHGLGAAQARHPGARRQRRGRRPRRLGARAGPGVGRGADRDLRQLPGAASPASRCSG